MRATISVLRVVACLGHLRGVMGESSDVCDDALAALAHGDLGPATSLLARAAFGTRDGPLRELIMEAWSLLDAVEAEIQLERDLRSARVLAGRGA